MAEVCRFRSDLRSKSAEFSPFYGIVSRKCSTSNAKADEIEVVRGSLVVQERFPVAITSSATEQGKVSLSMA